MDAPGGIFFPFGLAASFLVYRYCFEKFSLAPEMEEMPRIFAAIKRGKHTDRSNEAIEPFIVLRMTFFPPTQ
jgi:hypothetical protein